MKKILFVVMAAAAIGFTSCGNSQSNANKAESSVSEEIEATIASLSEATEGQDATKLQEALKAANEKIAELIQQDPEAAKEYVAKVQNYLNENVEQVKAVIGSDSIAVAAVSAITSVEPENVVNAILNQVNTQASETQGAIDDAANAAVDAAQQKVDDAKAAAQQTVDDAKAAAQKKVDDTKAAAQQKVDEAKAAAQKKADDAKADAQKKANDAVDDAANKLKKGLGL